MTTEADVIDRFEAQDREQSLHSDAIDEIPNDVNEINFFPIDDAFLDKLIVGDYRYALYLRVMILRIFMKYHRKELGERNALFRFADLFAFLGISNTDCLDSDIKLQYFKKELASTLARWEQELDENVAFFEQLRINLDLLGYAFDLTNQEKEVLGFLIIINADYELDEILNSLNINANLRSIERIISAGLKIDYEILLKIVSPSQKLVKTGLVGITSSDGFMFKKAITLISNDFPLIMVKPMSDVRSIVSGLLSQVCPAELNYQDFCHVGQWLDLCVRYLRLAFSNRKPGANILIYGKPGVGKTQFSKIIAKALGVGLLEVNSSDCSGEPIKAADRMKGYSVGQSLFSGTDNIIMIDECDEVIGGHNNFVKAVGIAAGNPTRSWLNNLLESNQVPAIWIANDIRRIDPACLRRFDVCFEMPGFTQAQRSALVASSFGNSISDPVKSVIATLDHVTPAVISKTSRLMTEVVHELPDHERDSLVLDIVSEILKLQRCITNRLKVPSAKPSLQFRHTYVNCDYDLKSLCENLARQGSARICVFGPPGTGKTAFGRWIAQSTGRQHITKKASDLMGKYVGETEKNIANAFAHAAREHSVLQFDGNRSINPI